MGTRMMDAGGTGGGMIVRLDSAITPQAVVRGLGEMERRR